MAPSAVVLGQDQKDLLDAYHHEVCQGIVRGPAWLWLMKNKVAPRQLDSVYLRRQEEWGNGPVPNPVDPQFPKSAEDLLR
jgi:hypothetical protein